MMEGIIDVLTTWYILLGLVVLLGLIGFWAYVRFFSKKDDE